MRSLMETISNWINPFELGEQDLVCLSSGKVATEKIHLYYHHQLGTDGS